MTHKTTRIFATNNTQIINKADQNYLSNDALDLNTLVQNFANAPNHKLQILITNTQPSPFIKNLNETMKKVPTDLLDVRSIEEKQTEEFLRLFPDKKLHAFKIENAADTTELVVAGTCNHPKFNAVETTTDNTKITLVGQVFDNAFKVAPALKM
jgi:hypothetical protein